MGNMKQIWFTEKDKIELREVPVPTVGYNQVKVKISYAALCATDVHMVTMGVMGAKPPMPLGHEASGVIVEMDKAAERSGLKTGDKVCLFPISTCGICDYCKKGMPQYCTNSMGVGAFAEYVVIDASAVYKIPDDADMQRYSLVEPTNCCVRAMDLAPISHGKTVAISGTGGIGSIMLNLIILSGASKITVVEPVKEKRENALQMGAQYAIDPFSENIEERAIEITGGMGFDYVFEMSGSPNAAEPAINILGKCGTVIYFAVFPPKYEMPLNLYNLYMKEGRLQTVFSTTTIMPRSINMISRMQMDKIIGKVIPLSDANTAFELFEKSIYPKILLDCSK